jgi:hypothetical protein
MTAPAAWHDIQGLDSLVDWGGGAAWDIAGCDPYLLWADVTTHRDAALTGRVAVLVELAHHDGHAGFREAIRSEDELSFIPGGLAQQDGTRFLTGFVTLAGLQNLVRLMGRGSVRRFTLQQSRTDLAVADGRLRDLVQERLNHDEGDAVWAQGEACAQGGEGTFLGIVDDGFPFAALTGLMNDPARRVHLWDQGWESYGSEAAPPGPESRGDPCWQTAWGWYTRQSRRGSEGAFAGFLYGRELKTLPPSAVAQAGGGRDVYADSRYFDRAPRHTHGAAVLALAAPWAVRGSAAAWPEHVSGLALVQLPTRTVDDTSGGSLAMRVLDGLRYMLWQESMSRPAAGVRNVVANVSYGVQAGPHDGSAMFERALQEMLDANPHLHVVLPAGNSHLAGCHARRVIGKSDSAELKLFVLPDNASDTHVELWLPKDAAVQVQIQSPGVAGPVAIGKHEAKVFATCAGSHATRIEFAATYAAEVAQSDTRTMVLISIGATRNDLNADGLGTAPGLNGEPRRAVLATPGLWRLTVRNLGSASVTVDAWIERDDAGADRSRGNRQAYFPDSGVEELRQHNASPEGTLNGIATLKHARVHVVGATTPDGQMARYSAAGEEGQGLPSAVAPADWSRAVSGLKTRGFAPGTVTRINGTSAASAVFARQLALAPIPRSLEIPDRGTVVQQSSSKIPTASPPLTPRAAEHQPEASRSLRGPQHQLPIPFDVFKQDA